MLLSSPNPAGSTSLLAHRSDGLVPKASSDNPKTLGAKETGADCRAGRVAPLPAPPQVDATTSQQTARPQRCFGRRHDQQSPNSLRYAPHHQGFSQAPRAADHPTNSRAGWIEIGAVEVVSWQFERGLKVLLNRLGILAGWSRRRLANKRDILRL